MKYVEDWINNSPMKVLNRLTPENFFNFILLRLIIPAAYEYVTNEQPDTAQ